MAFWQESSLDSWDDRTGNGRARWSRKRWAVWTDAALRAPLGGWTCLIVGDSEVKSAGHEFVHRWPPSTLFALLLVLNAPCQVRRAWDLEPESRTNCFITAFCLKGQKVSLARKRIINRKGEGEKNSICALPMSEAIARSVQIKGEKKRQIKARQQEQTHFCLQGECVWVLQLNIIADTVASVWISC